nr:reverse transcriptase domain-containing protein [Tanacetum cinerariifolium]
SFSTCLTNLENMLKGCEDTKLALNWEKSHFMVKEGIVLGHKISRKGIEVDKAKIEVISKLPHPTTVKGIKSFLGHAGFYRRFIKDFSKISRPMTHLLEKNSPFIFSNECIQAFNTLQDKLTEAPILIAPNWDQPFELMRSYFPPANTIPRHSRRKNTSIVEFEIQTNATMADNRPMAQMLQVPIEGYEDAIVVPPINANNFELKQTLINLVQSNQFIGRHDPHNHLCFFNKVTSTFRHPEVPNTTVKLLLFPFSLEGEARFWLDKEPP